MSFWSLDNNLDESEAKAGNSADRSMETGAEMRDAGKQTLALADSQAAKYAPVLDRSLGLQDAVSRDQQTRSGQVWDAYSGSFIPVQKQVAADAMNFDSPEALERAAQQAGADVSKSFGAGRDITQRNLERMGVNPNSGAFVRGTSNLGLEEAAAKSGAETNARDSRRLQAIGLRQGAAATGQAMAAGSNSNDQLALAGAQGQVTGANTAMQAPLAARATAVPWYTGSAAANNLGGTLAQDRWNTNVKADTEMMGQMANVVGSVSGYMSSKEVKKDKKSLNGKEVLDGLEEIPVEKWTYKKGVEDGGEHIGPYAEDVHEQFGDGVAPGGKRLDPVSMNGLALAAVKALAKKVKVLEDGSKSVRRSTEPAMKDGSRDTGRSRSSGSDVMEKTFGLTPIESSGAMAGAY